MKIDGITAMILRKKNKMFLKPLSFRKAQNAIHECTEGQYGILDVTDIFDRHGDVEKSSWEICEVQSGYSFPTSR